MVILLLTMVMLMVVMMSDDGEFVAEDNSQEFSCWLCGRLVAMNRQESA